MFCTWTVELCEWAFLRGADGHHGRRFMCVCVLGMVLLWLCLQSVDRICLFLALLFLVCGGVSTCISLCRHTSTSCLTLIDNINRAAKFLITTYLIKNILYFKIMKYLKTMAYVVGHNPRIGTILNQLFCLIKTFLLILLIYNWLQLTSAMEILV